MLPEISPETCSSQMPLPPLAMISQSVMRTSRPPGNARGRRRGSGMPPPSKVMPVRPILSAPSLWTHRGAAGEDERSRRARRSVASRSEPQHAGAIDAGGSPAALARAPLRRSRCSAGLVVGATGPHATAWRRGRARVQRRRTRAPAASPVRPPCRRRSLNEMAAVHVHGIGPRAMREAFADSSSAKCGAAW